MPEPRRIRISSDGDVVLARQAGRALASELGFAGSDLTVIATAISELARNIVVYAKDGEIQMTECHTGGRRGIEVVANDKGPGIPDIAKAMEDGFSTGKSLGLGLPGSKRLMDDFEITSKVGKGTTVLVRKWIR